jgi:sodium-independent sulfate anion transporter 11
LLVLCDLKEYYHWGKIIPLLFIVSFVAQGLTLPARGVMSTLVGSILIRVQAVHPEISGPTIASALAITCGASVVFLGFLRLGSIVDFIPLPAITAFMTGSAINVCAGPVKTVLGGKGTLFHAWSNVQDNH